MGYISILSYISISLLINYFNFQEFFRGRTRIMRSSTTKRSVIISQMIQPMIPQGFHVRCFSKTQLVPGVVGGGGGREASCPYILLNEIKTMFSQLAKQCSRCSSPMLVFLCFSLVCLFVCFFTCIKRPPLKGN